MIDTVNKCKYSMLDITSRTSLFICIDTNIKKEDFHELDDVCV